MAKPHQPTINRTSRQSLLFPLWQSQSTPRLSSPSLCLSGKGRYLGNTSHLSGNCSCGRSRHKTLGFPSLRVWSLLALPQETSCHQVGVPHQEVWLGMYWKRSSQGLGKRGGGRQLCCLLQPPRLACTQVRMLLVTCHGYSEELWRGGRP